MNIKGHLKKPLPGSSPDPDVYPLLPIVELAGTGRVLVENHQGVIQYSETQVGIRMKYGTLQVCGSVLTLEHMSQVKLTILGHIDSICVIRR